MTRGAGLDLTELLRLLGVSGGPILLGALVVKAMWNADDVLKADSKTALGKSSRSWWAFERSGLSQFCQVYDKLFGTQPSLRPSLRRYLLLGPLIITLAAIFVSLRSPSYTMHAFRPVLNGFGDNYFGLTWLAVAAIFMTTNVVFDYLSVWQLRGWTAIAARNPWLAPVALALGAAGAAFIFVLGWLAVLALGPSEELILLNSNNQSYWGEWYESGVYVLFQRDGLQNRLVDSYQAFVLQQQYASVDLGIWVFAVSFVTTLATTLWLWLYTISLVVGAMLKLLLSPLRSVLPHLAFEESPLRINGLISGVLIICVGAVAAIF